MSDSPIRQIDAASVITLFELQRSAKDRAVFHAQMASMLECLAGLCRTAHAPGEVAQVMLATGQRAEAIDRQMDDMLCCVVLLVQTWQRELRLTHALQTTAPGVH